MRAEKLDAPLSYCPISLSTSSMHNFSVIALASCLALLRPFTVHAQNARASLDLGSSKVRYADSIEVLAASLSPSFQLASARAYLTGLGTLSQMSGSNTYSGSVSGGVTTSAARLLSFELGSTFGGSSHSDGARTGQMLGTGRVYLNSGARGVWLGAGLGRTWDGTLWRGLVQGSLGAWVSASPGSAVLSFSPTVVDDTIQYADASLVLLREAGRFELSATGGTRFGEPVRSLVTDRLWGSISGVYWFAPRLGVVASAGIYPIDFTQGYPGGGFVSLGLRVATRRSSGVAIASPPVGMTDPSVRSFEVQTVAGESRRIRVLAPAASWVELSGDFTSWRPVRLTAEKGGWWSVTLPIGRGSHEMNVRVNDGNWTVPPGLLALRDEFGGVSGVLVIQQHE